MAEFKVGDVVQFTGWASQKYTIAESARAHIGTRTFDIYRISYEMVGKVCFADGWYDDTNLVSATTKKRYEIIRVVEAENEVEALKIRHQHHEFLGAGFEAREIK